MCGGGYCCVFTGALGQKRKDDGVTCLVSCPAWMLGTNHWSTGRGANTLNLWTILPAPGVSLFYFIILQIWVFFLSVHHMCTVPTEVIRGCQVSWNWSYKWLWTMWVLGIESRFIGRAASALKSEPSLYLWDCFFKVVVTYSWQRLLYATVLASNFIF